MIRIKDKDTGKPIGEITEEQLQFLVDQLEEEYAGDVDYYLTRATLENLTERGMDEGLNKLLLDAMGDRDELEIEWSKG